MIKIDKLNADEKVILNVDGKEVNTEMKPGEMLLFIIHHKAGVKGYNRLDVAKAFYAACEKDMNLAFIHNYSMWKERWVNGFWTEEQFNNRVANRKGYDLDEYEELKKIVREEEQDSYTIFYD